MMYFFRRFFGLREIPDKSKLEELLKEAQGIDLAKYTEETAATFRTALAKLRLYLKTKMYLIQM